MWPPRNFVGIIHRDKASQRHGLIHPHLLLPRDEYICVDQNQQDRADGTVRVRWSSESGIIEAKNSATSHKGAIAASAQAWNWLEVARPCASAPSDWTDNASDSVQVVPLLRIEPCATAKFAEAGCLRHHAPLSLGFFLSRRCCLGPVMRWRGACATKSITHISLHHSPAPRLLRSLPPDTTTIGSLQNLPLHSLNHL